MNYIILNNTSSVNISGLLIQELPSISKPKMRTMVEEIDGRDGDIVTKLGYGAYDKTLRIGLRGNYNIDDVIAFFNSEGTAVFSNEPDKYYYYQINEQIDFQRLVRFRTADVLIHCQPYKYDYTETEIDFTNTFIEDTEPYIFRANSHDANMMKLKKVVGGTVAWNQLMDDTWSANLDVANNQRAVVSAMPNGSSIRTGHKYLYRLTISASENLARLGNVDLYTKVSGTAVGINNIGFMADGQYYKIFNSSYNATADGVHTGLEGGLWLYSSLQAQDTSGKATISHINLIDLTQMFGSTIADYIYSLEQAHTGDGVAWFKALFPKAYYSYNAGELMSVKTSAHKTVGFNQWDEEWEVGTIDTQGQPTTTATRIRSKNYIPVLPSTQYYRKSPNNLQPFFYDANQDFIRYGIWGTGLFTTPANCYYLKFHVDPVYGLTYKNDICINISDASKNGTYEPYTVHNYPLDSDLTLRGIPKLDADHKLYYDGDTYASDGTVTRRYGMVDLGTLTWNSGTSGDASNKRYYAMGLASVIKKPSANSQYANMVCTKYVTNTESRGYAGTSLPCITCSASSGYVSVYGTSYTDAQTFKTAMSGVYLVYELATPTTESADAYTLSQRVGATEEFVDARTVAMPVGNESEYYDGTPEIVVTNAGNVPSKPIITIYGSGTVTVGLNGSDVFSIVFGDNEYITLDTADMNAYMGGVLLNRNVTGDYNSFALNTGENTITIDGTVTSVTIERYSRWL